MDLTAHHLPMADLRQLKLEATQRLLGDTIQISDEDWEGSSHLPGWTRAHVAAHLARNADAYRGIVEGVVDGTTVAMYPGDESRAWAIERGSEQTPLELQIDLDTSASRLAGAFDRLRPEQWDEPVRFDHQLYPVAFIVLSRLSEVVLHHVDLDCGFDLADVEEETALWLLRWCIRRLRDVPGECPCRIETPDGDAAVIGPPDPAAPTVSGSVAGLVGWLSGRTSADAVTSTGALGPRPII
ncbi:maleylpyruvate isomerase family mycothiol-dependent enzyme [Propionicicella superfundia]|uniref:maleylpyruvate isomerase family mycothiol-dependent enzyme n=1 Tax=Propionicicella superfundia TaxID=348582 RepID=UPI0006851ABB|nr:maleylpyruvate isomerase family mycothiol-dependent enzyme [Propionicicella superfundia]